MGQEVTVRPEDVAPSEFFPGGNTRIMLGAHGEGQWAHLSEFEAGFVIEPHSHPVDQFMIVLKGSATLAETERLTPGSVHFTSRDTPYGPIVAGPEGLTFLVIRPNTDHRVAYVPTKQIIDRVKAAQVPPRP